MPVPNSKLRDAEMIVAPMIDTKFVLIYVKSMWYVKYARKSWNMQKHK